MTHISSPKSENSIGSGSLVFPNMSPKMALINQTVGAACRVQVVQVLENQVNDEWAIVRMDCDSRQKQ